MLLKGEYFPPLSFISDCDGVYEAYLPSFQRYLQVSAALDMAAKQIEGGNIMNMSALTV